MFAMTAWHSLAFAAALLRAEPEPQPDCDGRVAGRVVDAATGEPVAQVQLRAGAAAARSDDDGRFTLAGLCPHDTTLVASRADYEPAQRRIAGGEDVAVVLQPRPVERVDDVVVEAPAPAPSELAGHATLDGEALAQLRGRNLADTVARVPGVTVLRSGNGAPGKPIIRGQDERRSLIINDGVRHAGQKWGLDHPPEIDPFAADRITVIKGPGGIRWGPDAIGGVVLIEPPPLRESPGVSGQAHVVGVSNGLRGTTALRLDGAHARAKGFAWRVDGNVSRGAAVITPRYPLANTGALVANGGVRLGYRRDRLELVASWRRNYTKNGLCPCLRNGTVAELQQSLQLGHPVNVGLYSRGYAIGRAYHVAIHDLALLRAAIELGDAGTLTSQYSLQNNERREFDVVRAGVSGPQYSFGLRTHALDVWFDRAARRLAPRLSSTGSYGATLAAQRNRFQSNQTLIPDYDQVHGGVFALERLSWRRVELQAGVRYDGITRTASLRQRDYLGQVASGRLYPSRCERTAGGGARCGLGFHAGSVALATVVRPIPSDDGFAVRLEASSAARIPAVDELFMNGSSPSFPVLARGDARLGIERTWGTALSLEYANRFLSTDGAAWVNWIDDFIYFGPVRGPGAVEQTVHGALPVFAFRPVGALFYGGEWGGRLAPPKWPVELDAQLALVRAIDLRNRQYLVFIPADRYQLGLTYRWPDTARVTGGSVGVRAGYVDRQRRYDPDADFAAPPPGYVLLGASVGFDVPLPPQTLSFALVGNNLTNTRYRDYTSLLRYFADEPGWELMLRVSLAFEATRPRPRARTHRAGA